MLLGVGGLVYVGGRKIVVVCYVVGGVCFVGVGFWSGGGDRCGSGVGDVVDESF